MKYVLALSMLFVLSVSGAAWAASWFRRTRRLRRIESAEIEVVGALDDGRLARQTGEALLQHLDGLRRECRQRNRA